MGRFGCREYLFQHIGLSSTEEGQVILEPFCASGIIGVKAV